MTAAPVTPTRRVLLESAITMSPDVGDVFDTLMGLVRWGLGGRAGDGRQFVSWVHEDDFVQAIRWLLVHDEIDGAVNIASPSPLPNTDFMRALRDAAGIGIGLPSTTWMLEVGALFMRTETELLLKSRRVVLARLLEHSFHSGSQTQPAASDLFAPVGRSEKGRRPSVNCGSAFEPHRYPLPPAFVALGRWHGRPGCTSGGGRWIGRALGGANDDGTESRQSARLVALLAWNFAVNVPSREVSVPLHLFGGEHGRSEPPLAGATEPVISTACDTCGIRLTFGSAGTTVNDILPFSLFFLPFSDALSSEYVPFDDPATRQPVKVESTSVFLSCRNSRHADNDGANKCDHTTLHVSNLRVISISYDAHVGGVSPHGGRRRLLEIRSECVVILVPTI